MKEYQAKKQEYLAQQELLQQFRGKETVSLDGQKVKLYANIGNASDIGAVIKNDAAGIGLFRSEFLYLENDNFPTEEEQFKVYKYVAETMGQKQVIIRTLDIGADKQIDYFNLPHEENPAMGYRAYTAACSAACICIWKHCHHVPDDRGTGRSTADQRDRKECYGRIRCKWHPVQQRDPAWYHDRDTGSSHDQR